jgi:Ca2+-binding RTX toxin-like protein
VTAPAGETNHIEVVGSGANYIVRETGTAPLTSSAPSCSASGVKQFTCTIFAPGSTAPTTGIFVGLQNLDDSVKVTSQPPSLFVELSGGDGNDTLISGPGVQITLDGNNGFDTVDYSTGHPAAVNVSLDGVANDGGSNDGGSENVRNIERVIGGDGNDFFRGNTGANTFEGRAGVDTVSYSERTAAQPVTVTANGVGGDGMAGEGDNVGTDIENITAGAGNDTLGGNAAKNLLNGGSGIDTATYAGTALNVVANLDNLANDGPAGEDDQLSGFESLTGGNGNDSLTGSTGPNRLDGGPGADVLEAGDGADAVVGGDGNDQLIGGAGIDSYAAGAGNDSATAFDGLGEPVDCGTGTDTATVDVADKLTACETVRRVDEILDVDRDGSLTPQDCNDNNPAIRPGANDIPRNGIDEDCSGSDAKRRSVQSTITHQWAFNNVFAQARKFTINKVPARGVVRLKCKPPKGRKRACPFKVKRRESVRGAKHMSFLSAFKKKKLPVGTVIEVRITRKNWIGRVFRFKVRSSKIPRVRTLCLAPGKKKPGKC